jgi:hypothetical protein
MVGLGSGAAEPSAAAPVAPPPSPPGAPTDDDTVAELERLARLRASGALTDEEFQQAKRRVLGPQG